MTHVQPDPIDTGDELCTCRFHSWSPKRDLLNKLVKEIAEKAVAILDVATIRVSAFKLLVVGFVELAEGLTKCFAVHYQGVAVRESLSEFEH
jgi:hypothetical protein